MQKFSYHSHTNFSDGKNTIEEMIIEAEKQGFEEIGLSDHMIVHKNFQQSPSWQNLQGYYAPQIYRTSFKEAADAFNSHAEQVRKVAKNHSIKVYVGAETDYFTYDGWEQEFKEFKSKVDLDYYQTGNHFYESPNEIPIHPLFTGEYYSLPQNQIDLIKRHLNTLCLAATSGHFCFVAHFDYMRRTPLFSDPVFDSAKQDFLKACKSSGIAIEINTKQISAGDDPYPALSWIKEMQRLDVPTLLSDDAHNAKNIAQNFASVEKILSDLGYTNRWKMNKKK